MTCRDTNTLNGEIDCSEDDYEDPLEDEYDENEENQVDIGRLKEIQKLLESETRSHKPELEKLGDWLSKLGNTKENGWEEYEGVARWIAERSRLLRLLNTLLKRQSKEVSLLRIILVILDDIMNVKRKSVILAVLSEGSLLDSIQNVMEQNLEEVELPRLCVSILCSSSYFNQTALKVFKRGGSQSKEEETGTKKKKRKEEEKKEKKEKGRKKRKTIYHSIQKTLRRHLSDTQVQKSIGLLLSRLNSTQVYNFRQHILETPKLLKDIHFAMQQNINSIQIQLPFLSFFYGFVRDNEPDTILQEGYLGKSTIDGDTLQSHLSL
jgi:hypothetical protein